MCMCCVVILGFSALHQGFLLCVRIVGQFQAQGKLLFSSCLRRFEVSCYPWLNHQPGQWEVSGCMLLGVMRAAFFLQAFLNALATLHAPAICQLSEPLL